MKTTMSGLIYFLFAVSGMALLAGNAQAHIDMPEREQVQTIVRLVEFASFVTFVAIAGVVWRISKRASKNKKAEQEQHKTD